MVTSLVIPRDGAGSVRVRELASIGEFQAIVDGFLEPIEITALGITVWVNEAAARQRRGMNSRATALWWYYCADTSGRRFIIGDVVLTGAGESFVDVPEHFIHGLLAPHDFVIQVSPHGDEEWFDTQGRFNSLFEAATWCMIVGLSVRPGPAFRITPELPDGLICGYDAPRGDLSW